MPSTWCGREMGRKKGHFNEHGLLLFVSCLLCLLLLLGRLVVARHTCSAVHAVAGRRS